MKDCDLTQQRLLDDPDVTDWPPDVQAHLRICPDCRQFRQQIEALRSMAACRRAAVPNSLAESVRVQCRDLWLHMAPESEGKAPAPGRWRAGLTGSLWLPVTAVVLLLVMMIAVLLGEAMAPGPESADVFLYGFFMVWMIQNLLMALFSPLLLRRSPLQQR
ncbi:MAG: hypothetical protein Q9P14_10410 [candidate division KSB1 bacterium]|nr:hypothetical protein [candidate division KSB1 bacterium]MDQ7064397.1 hypothetical protein [candidate division KSB1 bacterium]